MKRQSGLIIWRIANFTFIILGHWGECDPQKCTNNALYTQEDNKLALEVSDLIKEYETSDTLNNDIGTRLELSIPLECPCVEIQRCVRTKHILDKLSSLSKSHPQRNGIIKYIRTQICDVKNKKVKCCGEQIGLTQNPTLSLPRSRQRVPSSEKVYYSKY